ncbi:hypothetical protein ACI7RC_10760 [Brevibacillus sp. B_LB10_24]|uniref:hypothetical protein n=1 Tax=Brevibacillus sp. B_LB10_24 TaxID=3380645 RepID=UPI0038BDA9DA
MMQYIETPTPSKTGRIDMGLWVEDLYGNHTLEIFELRPISNSPSGNKTANKAVLKQLLGYVNDFNKHGIYAIQGRSWNPNGLELPHPTDPNKMIKLYTYSSDPGMIYYGEIKKKQDTQPKTELQKILDNETLTSSEKINIILGGGIPGSKMPTVRPGFPVLRPV